MTLLIRTAVPADAHALAAALHAHVHADVDAAARFADLIAAHPGSVHVALDEAHVVGHVALLRAAHAAVHCRAPLQLWQLYVSPQFHGRGVAAALMERTFEQARLHKCDVVWLGVSEHNDRAIAFYRKCGFDALGLHRVGDDAHAHEDLLMARRMEAPAG
jgi:ribosomal protein S18 acetylase RimI-like enzyme